MICNLLYFYYNKYMEQHRYISSRELTPDDCNKVCNILMKELTMRYNSIPTIESVDILSFMDYGKTYYCDELNMSDIDDMYQRLSTFIEDLNYVINFDYIISINVCPFDGFEICHNDVIMLECNFLC